MSKEIAPIVIDLGRVSRKRIRALKKGSGVLVDEIAEVVDRIRAELAELGDDAKDKQLVPVVVIYKRKKPQKQREGLIDLLFSA